MKPLALLFLFSLTGCAARTGAEAIVLDQEINLCRVIRTSITAWRVCRTHPSVTPELLQEARLVHERLGVPLPIAIRTLTGWRVYGLDIDTAGQVDAWRAAMAEQRAPSPERDGPWTWPDSSRSPHGGYERQLE